MRRISEVLMAGAAMLMLTSLANAQLPVEDGLLLWLDATDADSIEEIDGCVDTWSDKSGNGYDAVLPLDNLTACPEYSANAMNGQAAVRFHAETADGMEVLDLVVDQRPYTAFIVNQYWGPTKGRTLQGTDANWLLGLWSSRVGHYAEGWVRHPDTGPLPYARDNFVYVAEATGSEFDSEFYVNGFDQTLDPAPLGSPGGLGLVGYGAFPAELSDADISEVIFFDRILDDNELEAMRNHLYTKYGATTSASAGIASVEDIYRTPDPMTVFAGTVGTFSSSTDLDFSGDFAYAINVGGPDLVDDIDDIVIGDAQFTAGTNDDIDDVDSAGNGVSMTVANQIPDWFNVALTEFGDGTLDDDNLAFALQSIRWNVPPGLDIDLEVEQGQAYKLQLLFGEQCCIRGFDITVEGEMVVDNLLVSDVQDGTVDQKANGINKGDTPVHFTYEFTAGDDVLNLNLGGVLPGAPDNNPILNALTLEKIELITSCNPDSQGDLDGNGKVEFADFLTLSANFGMTVSDHTEGDIDCNGKVEFADFLELSANFGKTVAAQSVPEPSGHFLIVLAALSGMLVRRRR